ncbi:hypothetical protein [Saccharopolyspora hattusasensis]|uniref:WXG100-like domain-containing protein n=1 Tax=Saccharopolyspora hattusasensis TaxID=1128679 RepID=UPI003D96368E
MFSSIMVPEGVRRLFQVLTGEDMTDADEGVLFAVADALEAGAAGLGEVRALVAELVGKVRTEFSGKAADRFADGLGIFDGLLSSGQAGLLDLAVFVRKTSQQVRYLKLVTIYSLELLAVEMSWAMQFAGATAGASLAWLAARMAVMRFLLTSWWRQLFMRLAMMAAGGVVFNVLPDVQAQLQMWGEESAEKWDRTLTEQAAGMGAFSALVALPMSAVGGLVSNMLTKVLVKGLGDDVDAAILEAAVKKAVAEHAELYPVSAMAKFADAVGKSLDDYAGMSVGAMWLARFGHSVGEAVAGSLSEFFGEALYAAATGQEVTWNPFSLTAGLFETVFSGVGNLAGLALRGKLHPEGPSPYLEGTGGGGDGSDDGGGSGGEKAPLLGAGSGSQTGNIPGSLDKDSTFIPSDTSQSASSDASRSDASDASRSDGWAGSDSGAGSDSSSVSDVDSVFSGTGSVDSAAVSVSSGEGLVVPGSAVVSAVVVGGTDGKDGTDGTDAKRGADGGVPGGTPARDVPVVPGSGQHRPGTPPPAYSGGVSGVDPDRPGTPLPAHFGGVPGVGSDRPGTPPPPYSPVAGGDQAVPGKRPLEVSASKTPDSPTVTPHASDVPADAPRPETVRSEAVVGPGGVPADAARPGTVGSGSVVGSDGRVPAGHQVSGAVGSGSVVGSGGGVPAGHPASEAVGSGSVSGSGVPGGHPGSQGGVAGRDGDPAVDEAVVSPDSVTLSGEGSQAASSLHRDPAAVLLAGLPADTVRVPVSAEVVAGDGLAEFVQGVAGSPGGPVLLVSERDPDAGVVVPSGQGSALAQYLGRNVVAMTPGQAGREPQLTVFPADGSRPKPLAGPGAAVLAAGRSGGVAGLADASATVPASGGEPVARGEAPAVQQRSVVGEGQPAAAAPDAGAGTVRDTSRIPVGQWTPSELRRAIAEAKQLELSSKEKEKAGQIVWSAHDVAALARGDAVVPLEDVVALVAAKYHDLGPEHRDQVVEFSGALADMLGTWRSEPVIHAGAGPARPSASGVEPAPVPFGELKPLRDPVDAWGSEQRGGEGSLPDVVDGRRVVLGAGDLAGVSEEGRGALDAFVGVTGVAARPRLAGVDGHAEVDGHHVLAFLWMLDRWGVVDHAVVVKKRKTTWSARHMRWPNLNGPELVEEGTDVWYVMGEYAPGERPDNAKRPDDLRGPLTQGPLALKEVPPHLNPNGEFPPGTWLANRGESVEFFVHVLDRAGARVEYGLADQGLLLRGREAEWEGLFAALHDKGPAELMNMVNPDVYRDLYLAQALGVDETTAQVWRMWSYLPEKWHAEALRRAITGSVVSKYGGREAVKTLVETLVPDGPRYQKRLRALGELMMTLADRRRRLERWNEVTRATPSAADYRRALQHKVDELGGLDQMAESKPGVEATRLAGPALQRAGELGRRPSPRGLNVLRELVHALDGRELDYLTRFFGDVVDVARAVGVYLGDVRALRLGRGSDRAAVRGILLDAFVAAFGGPEGAVAVADRLRELGIEMGLRMFADGRPEEAAIAARTVLGLPIMQEWGAWTLPEVLEYVAGDAVPAGVPDERLVRHLGPARAALVTGVDESTVQEWLDGRSQPTALERHEMREAARLSSSELVRCLGPGRTLEVTDADQGPVYESEVWEWLEGFPEPDAEDTGKLRLAVLRAIRDGLMQGPQPLWRVVWSGNGIREAERRLAWADATKEDEFPSDAWEQWKSDARSQWEKVDDPDPSLPRESREVFNGLGKSLEASVNYIVVQVLLGNAYARDMVAGSGIVIPDPGQDPDPGAVTGLLEQIADHLRAAKDMLDSGVLRRMVGGAASERFQEATGGVVPQLRLTGGPGAVREFMRQTAAGDEVHFLVVRVPSAASRDALRAAYVKGADADAFVASGDFFEGGQAHYFLDTVQGDDRRIDPKSVPSEVVADAGADVAWWVQHGGLHARAGGSDDSGFAAPVLRGKSSILGGPEQVAWLDGQLPRVAELLDLPESERLERLGNLAGIAELAELAGRMEQHLTAPGFDPDGKRALSVEAAKRMVRRGAWTSTDLQTVADRLPEMRKVEKIWGDLASRAREATGEGKRRTSADPADPDDSARGGKRRRRLAWPGVVPEEVASASAAGNEPGGAGLERATLLRLGGPPPGRIASSPTGQPGPVPDAIEPAPLLQPVLVPAASGGTTVAGGEASATGTGSAQARSVAAGVQPAATTPGAGAGTVRDTSEIPVGQWTQEDLDRAIAEAKKLDLSSDEKEKAGQIVQSTHDVQRLARGDAVVPLRYVVALVAAKYHDVGPEHRAEVVEFSGALADLLRTRRSEPVIHAGAGPAQPSGVEPAPVPFGELKPLTPLTPLVDGGSELRGGDAEYGRDGSRGSLPDVVDGRRVVLGAEDLAGLSEEGRAALEAFQAATGVAAEPRLADVDGHNVLAHLRMRLDLLGVADRAVVVRKRKTTWRVHTWSDLDGRELVEEGIDAWYVMGEYAPGARPDGAMRPEDLWGPLTLGAPDQATVSELDPNREFSSDDADLENIGESFEFFVHVVDSAGVRVEYGLADPGLWRRGREVEWGGLFAAVQDEGRPAELMNRVNPAVRESRYLAQALGVDEATAQVWRMWSYLPEGHAAALRRAITGSTVSTYGGREEVKNLVKDLLPDGPPYDGRLQVLGQFMVRLADRRRLRGRWGEERRAQLGVPRSAAEYRAELREMVAGLGGLDQDMEVEVEVPVLEGPPPQRAGERDGQPSQRELNVLQELVHALDGREVDYLLRFFGTDAMVGDAIGDYEWRRGGDRAVMRGILLDLFVEAFGGPEGAVALADRLRELGRGPLKQLGWEMALEGELDPRRGVQVASQGQPDPQTAKTVLFLLMDDSLPWNLGDLVEYVAGGAVPAGVPDGELVSRLGTARAALVTGVSESTAQRWLDGRQQPEPEHLQRMREDVRLPSSEVVRYLGPGRAIEVTDTGWLARDESDVWEWLMGFVEPRAGEAGKLRLEVLRAIRDGFVPPAPFRRLGWSESWIREAERRLAWADAKKGSEFPSEAWEQWKEVKDSVRSLRPESRAVMDGLGKSLRASVNYIVVQVLLGNEIAKAMVAGSGIVVPAPGPKAATELLDQIADSVRAADGMLHSGVLRRVVGGAASGLFQAATGGVVPQPRLTGGPAAVREFMGQWAGDDVHFLVLKVPETSQDVPRAEYVNGNDETNAFLASGYFFKNGPAHYFVDAVQGDGRRIHPGSTLTLGVMADAGDAVAWWPGRLHAPAGGSDGGGPAASALLGEGLQPAAGDVILGGPVQAALDGGLPRVLDLPESVRRERLGNLAGIAEVAELAGRMEQHLEAMPGFDPDGERKRNVDVAKRMVRQGAWTAEDLQWVKDGLPGMRAVEKKWRGLASLSSRSAAERELLWSSDEADVALEELSGPARKILLDRASIALGEPFNGSQRAVSVLAYHMMRGVGDGEIARVRNRLARMLVALTAVSAGAGPEPGTGRGAGSESVGDAGVVPALGGDVRPEFTGDASGDPATAPRSESTEDVVGSTGSDGGGGAGTFGRGSPDSEERFKSWLTEIAFLRGDGLRRALGRDGGGVLRGQVDGPRASAWDAESSAGTPTDGAAIDKAVSDEFDTVMNNEQPGLLERLKRVGGTGGGLRPESAVDVRDAGTDDAGGGLGKKARAALLARLSRLSVASPSGGTWPVEGSGVDGGAFGVALRELKGADPGSRAKAYAYADRVLGELSGESLTARVLMAHQYLMSPDDGTVAERLRVERERQVIGLAHISAGAGPEPGPGGQAAGQSGESSAAGGGSGQAGGLSQPHAAVPVDEGAGVAGHQTEREQRAERIAAGLAELAELNAEKAELEKSFPGQKFDPIREAMLEGREWDPVQHRELEALQERIETVQAEVDTLLTERDWDERYTRAEKRLGEWAEIVGFDVVDRLSADADGILGPLKASGRFRVVMAHWLGEHRNDARGAQAVRVEMAGYLGGDSGIGMAVSGLPRDAFEAARAQEQAARAGNQAEAVALMVRGDAYESALEVISRISSVQQEFSDAGHELASVENKDDVDRLYVAADKVLGPLAESKPFEDVMARALLKKLENLRDKPQERQQLMTNPQADQQVQELRWRLVKYLAGDTSGGENQKYAEKLLSATVTPTTGIGVTQSTASQMDYRHVAVGTALSGFKGSEIRELLRNEALKDALGKDYDASELGKRYNRSRPWGDKVLGDARARLISDLKNSVASLEKVLEGEADTNLREEYEAKIKSWLDLKVAQRRTIRRRTAEVAAAVESLGRKPSKRAAEQLSERGKIAGQDGGVDGDAEWHARESEIRQEFAKAGQALASEQDQDRVTGLYAAAGEVLGPLAESKPFKDVMAHALLKKLENLGDKPQERQQLMKNPQADQQVQELRWRLVCYLAGDLSGRPEPSTADNSRPAAATRAPKKNRSEALRIYQRNIAVGKALSGLRDDTAVNKMLQDDAIAEARRRWYTSERLGERYNRARSWGASVLEVVRKLLSSDLENSVDSLRHILAKVETEAAAAAAEAAEAAAAAVTITKLRNAYRAKIEKWENNTYKAHAKTVFDRASEAAAAVEEFRGEYRNYAVQKLRWIYETTRGGFAQLQVRYGREVEDGEFYQIFRELQDDSQLWDAVAHRLVANGGQLKDAQAFLQRLHDLRLAASAVSAGAGPEPGRGLVWPSVQEPWQADLARRQGEVAAVSLIKQEFAEAGQALAGQALASEQDQDRVNGLYAAAGEVLGPLAVSKPFRDVMAHALLKKLENLGDKPQEQQQLMTNPQADQQVQELRWRLVCYLAGDLSGRPEPSTADTTVTSGPRADRADGREDYPHRVWVGARLSGLWDTDVNKVLREEAIAEVLRTEYTNTNRAGLAARFARSESWASSVLREVRKQLASDLKATVGSLRQILAEPENTDLQREYDPKIEEWLNNIDSAYTNSVRNRASEAADALQRLQGALVTHGGQENRIADAQQFLQRPNLPSLAVNEGAGPEPGRDMQPESDYVWGNADADDHETIVDEMIVDETEQQLERLHGEDPSQPLGSGGLNQVAGSGESSAVAELRAWIAEADAGLKRMRDKKGQSVDDLIDGVKPSMGAIGVHDGARRVMAHYIMSHPENHAGIKERHQTLRNLVVRDPQLYQELRELAVRDWNERYDRAEAQLREWLGSAGHDRAAGLLSDAVRILGPLSRSGRFRYVLAHWLDEHPGNPRGAEAVRGEMADYLAGDLGDLGVVVSGLSHDEIEAVRTEEQGNLIMREFAEAGQALDDQALASEQDRARVNGLYADAEEVLGPLAESIPFRHVMARELMKPPADQQVKELRWKLICYLVGDLSGRPEPSTADTTVTSEPRADRVDGRQSYALGVQLGAQLSGLGDTDAANRVLRNEAIAEALRTEYTAARLAARFARSRTWGSNVLKKVREQLASDLKATVKSLEQILAEPEMNSGLRDKYKAKIRMWLLYLDSVQIKTIRGRVSEAAADVEKLQREYSEYATQELQAIYAIVSGGFANLQGQYGLNRVVSTFRQHFREIWDDTQLRDAVAHRLLTNGDQLDDAREFLRRLQRLRRAESAVSAGSGPETASVAGAGEPVTGGSGWTRQNRDGVFRASWRADDRTDTGTTDGGTAERGGETDRGSVRRSGLEPGTTPADPQTVSTAPTETAREAREQSASLYRSSGSRGFGGRGAPFDEEFLADDSSESSADVHGDQVVEFSQALAELGTEGSGLAVWAGAGSEGQVAGRSGESSEEEEADLGELIAKANAGLEGMRGQGLPVDELMLAVQERMGALLGGDGLRKVVAHHMLSKPGDVEATQKFLRKFYALVWDELYERAAAQLKEWDGIAPRIGGRDAAVDRLLSDADRILGPLSESERFRYVLAHWLGEHPGDGHGAQAARVEMAKYLDDGPDIGAAVSGLTRDAFEEMRAKEELRAEEERWQAYRAGDQAEAAAVTVPMVRRVEDDPALAVFSRVSSVKRRLAEAGQALASEQDQGFVDGLYAVADRVLGPLAESKPFRDVMAHALLKKLENLWDKPQEQQQLMTNPQADQQLQELRWELVSYLAGDLSDGADPSTANKLLSATITRYPGEKYSGAVQDYQRRVAVGVALSGLPDKAAVKRVLQTEGREEALSRNYKEDTLGARFNRSRNWGRQVLEDVRKQLIFDLQATAGSLRQILAAVEPYTDLWYAYEAKIAEWSALEGVDVKEIRSRVQVASDALERLRNAAKLELQNIFEAADWLQQFEDLSGPASVVQAFFDVDQRFGRMQDDQLRRAVVHWWLTNGSHLGDAQDRTGHAQAFLQRLYGLKIAAMGVSAIRAGLFLRSGLSDDGLLLGAARRISSRPDRFVVVARGDGRGGVLVDGRPVDARTLADVIRRSPNWDPEAGVSVWLFACAVSPEYVTELKELLNSRVRHGVGGLTWIGPGTGDSLAMVTTTAVVTANGVMRLQEPPTGRVLEYLPGVDEPVELGPDGFRRDPETPRGLGLPHPVHLNDDTASEETVSTAESAVDGDAVSVQGDAVSQATSGGWQFDSDEADSAGSGAVAGSSVRLGVVGESRADGATGPVDVDRVEQARRVVADYADSVGGWAELAREIGLHRQETGFRRLSSRRVPNYEQRLITVTRLMLDVFGSAWGESARPVSDLHNVRRLFDAVRRRYPYVGESVTIDHVRQMVRDFNPADRRPVSDADVRTLVELVEIARDRWRGATFESLESVWRAQTVPVELPGLVVLGALESIAGRLEANRVWLEANNRRGLLARVDVFRANVREERGTHWRPTDRSRLSSLGDLQITGEWLIQEASADVSDRAVAALVALAEEHGGGRAVAQAVGVDSRYAARDRQNLGDVVRWDWEQLAIVVRLAMDRYGARPTLYQVRATELDPLGPRVQRQETSAEGESDSDGGDSTGVGAVAGPSVRPGVVGEGRADGATGPIDVNRVAQAWNVLDDYADTAGGWAELAEAIGLHHQERGFRRFSPRWVPNYERRLVNIAELMLEVFDSAPGDDARPVSDLRDVRRLFDAVRRRYPYVGEYVTIDHVRRMVRDFNPADRRPVSDVDVRTLVRLVESARDRWRGVTFKTLRSAWRAQTDLVENPGRAALSALEIIADWSGPMRERLEANNREGLLLTRVDIFRANVQQERETPWRPTDLSRVDSLGDLQITGEWLIQEASADVSDRAVAALVALAEEHGGGRAVAQAVDVDSRYAARDRQNLRDTVHRVWARLTNIAWLAMDRFGDRPTLDQLRQAAELGRLIPRVLMLRVQGVDDRLGPMPADLDEARLAGYLRSAVELWAAGPGAERQVGRVVARPVTEDDVRHLADLMMSLARGGVGTVTWARLERVWNTERRAVTERVEGAVVALRRAVEEMTWDLASLPSWYRGDLRVLADGIASVAGAQVFRDMESGLVLLRPADALVADRLEQLQTRAVALAGQIRAAREAADLVPVGPLMLADELVRRFGRDELGVAGDGALGDADRRRIVRLGALASVLADVRSAADLDVEDVRHARQVAGALEDANAGLRATGVGPENLRSVVRDFLGLPAGARVSHEDIRSLATQLVAVAPEPGMLREVGSRWVSDRINSALSGLWSAYDRIARHMADLPGDYRPDLRAAMAEAARFRGPVNARWAVEDGRQVLRLEESRSGLESLARDVSMGDPDANSSLTTMVRAVESLEARSEAPRAGVGRSDDSGSGGPFERDAAPGLHGVAGAFQSVLRQEPRAIRAGLFLRSGLSDDGRLLGAAQRISYRSDRFVVVARGDGRGRVLVDGRSVSPRTLADVIRRSPNWDPEAGASVWLFACAVSPAYVKELKELLNSRVRHGVGGLTWIGPGTGDSLAMVTAAVVTADGAMRPQEPPTGRVLEHLPGVDEPVDLGPGAFPLDPETPSGLGLPHPVHLRAPVDESAARPQVRLPGDLG